MRSITTPEEQPDEASKEGISDGAVAGVVVGSTAVAGTGGFSLFVIQEKSWVDLLGLFEK